MLSSSDYGTKNNHGSDTTSNDYHAHLSRMVRTPTLLADAPQYPNVHMVFNNKVVYKEEQVAEADRHKKKNVPEAQKKVHFVEQQKTVECDENGDCKVVEESVDAEAEGFLQHKHKNFELCKWRTFEKKNVPEAQKKVHFVEQQKTVECDENGNCKVVEESVDAEAEGFLQQKHKNFELCKWRTFKTN